MPRTDVVRDKSLSCLRPQQLPNSTVASGEIKDRSGSRNVPLQSRDHKWQTPMGFGARNCRLLHGSLRPARSDSIPGNGPDSILELCTDKPVVDCESVPVRCAPCRFPCSGALHAAAARIKEAVTRLRLRGRMRGNKRARLFKREARSKGRAMSNYAAAASAYRVRNRTGP
jgi:hypothetical protein